MMLLKSKSLTDGGVSMFELKKCPYCGGKSEMYTGRNFPEYGKSLCKTKEEAEALLEQYRAVGIVVKWNIYQRFRRSLTGNERWGVRVVHQGFIPRCLNTKCVGRNAMMFHTEEEAADAWNRRSEDGK
jgi:hypothetical protein